MSFQLHNYQLSLKKTPLFDAFSLNVKAGEIGAITGSSGSGKSTILADISGFLPPEFKRKGDIILNSQYIDVLPIERRQVGILFQDDLLFPHLDVFENLVFGLPKSLSKQQKKHQIDQALTEAGLEQYQHRDISTLSGGQRSRVSLLRTLLSQPKLILLDEPFSKLDQALRNQFRLWVFEHIAQQNIPAILVTHDKEDIPPNSHVIELGDSHA